MFPDIDGQQRLHAMRDRRIRIGGLEHFELGTLLHQPHPAASELSEGSGSQMSLTGIDAAECCFNLVLMGRWWLAAASGFETSPVKVVIPHLRRVVENARAVCPGRGFDYDALQRQLGKLRTRDQGVCSFDIAPVLPAVMKAQRGSGNYGSSAFSA
jgi:hypothetical protein